MTLRKYSKISDDLKTEVIMLIVREIVSNPNVQIGATSSPKDLGSGLIREIAEKLSVNIYRKTVVGILCDLSDTIGGIINREILEKP